ncbi:MAG: DegQ family serine endoprotease, partial [Nitrospiria bacterium]
RLIFSAFLLVVGIIVGVTLVSEFHSVPSGRAIDETLKETLKRKPPAIAETEQAFVGVSKAVTPSVVNISTTRTVRQRRDSPIFPFDDPIFRRFFGEDPFERRGGPREHKAQSLGSGVIVDPDGLIVTNNHVIEKADEIKVLLSDKREFTGKVVGTDPKSDLAVIRIDAANLPSVTWGDSSKLQVGEYILAIGNPFGFTQTVTMGIVSAVGRANVGLTDYEDFIQTDAAINPGNSGGAMVNIHGELVGINTAIFTQSGGYMGIGFAVPSNMAKSVVKSLVKEGKVVRGWLGVAIQEVTSQLAEGFGLKEVRGALVSEVLSDSPAERAGFKRGDVIITFMGKPVDDASRLRNIVARTEVGTRGKVKVIRDKEEIALEVLIETQPKDMFARRREGKDDRPSTSLSGIEVKTLTPDLARQTGISPDDSGVVVMTIEPGSAAEEAGLRRGDLIMEVNRRSIHDTRDYEEQLSKRTNEPILLLIRRQDRTLFLTVTP